MWIVLFGLLVVTLGGFAAVRPDMAATVMRVDAAGVATNSIRFLGATIMAIGLMVLVWL